MGNLCCKRQRIYPDLESINSSENQTTENNLELYLNDVYEKECVFKASPEEVEFIQTEIETLVQDIVDEALDLFPTCVKTNKIFGIKERKTELKKYFTPTRSSIIKVGSFYEGTRNNFPDEFDFIFPLFCGREELSYELWRAIHSAVYSCIESVIIRKSCSRIESAVFSCIQCVITRNFAYPNGTREIYLNPGRGIELHGPACKLQFIYKNGSTKERHIAVDLVPAYKIVVDHKPDWYVRYVNRYVEPKSFHDEIMSAESCFVVKRSSGISFTETEVSFIRNVLSRHHVKVYRILKFLLNGNGDDQTMKICLMRHHLSLTSKDEESYKPYSSYQIKTMMIYHHDECRNSDTTDIGPCVLQVLEEMCEYKIRYPIFSPISYEQQYLVDYLQSLTDTLKNMHAKTDDYSYDRYKMKSVTMQYFENRLEDVKRSLCRRYSFFDRILSNVITH